MLPLAIDQNNDRSGLATDAYRPNYVIAAERVIELIAARRLRPGDRLPTEQALANELSYGRGVIREALKILSALGRIKAHRGRGLFVADDASIRLGTGTTVETFLPADPQHVDELLRFRQILEGAAAHRAALYAKPPQLKDLREAASACTDAAATGDRESFDRADARFHRYLAEASGNRFLQSATATARQLQGQVVVIGLQGGTGGSMVEAAADHQAIVDAISNGDVAEATRAAEFHIERTLTGYQAEIASHLREISYQAQLAEETPPV